MRLSAFPANLFGREAFVKACPTGPADLRRAAGGQAELSRTMSVTRDELVRKAQAFRLRAEEVRAVAEEMRGASARLAMFQLAETYESVARHLEATHVLDGSVQSQAG